MFEILLVEDSAVDVRLVQEALEDNSLLKNLHVVSDGDRAIAFLKREGEHAESPRPHLVLLDLNLPGTSGFEVLEAIKGDAELKRIPVVILTSSKSDADRRKCYDLHANAFMTKVIEFEDLQSMMSSMSEYWFGKVQLPPR